MLRELIRSDPIAEAPPLRHSMPAALPCCGCAVKGMDAAHMSTQNVAAGFPDYAARAKVLLTCGVSTCAQGRQRLVVVPPMFARVDWTWG